MSLHKKEAMTVLLEYVDIGTYENCDGWAKQHTHFLNMTTCISIIKKSRWAIMVVEWKTHRLFISALECKTLSNV